MNMDFCAITEVSKNISSFEQEDSTIQCGVSSQQIIRDKKIVYENIKLDKMGEEFE